MEIVRSDYGRLLDRVRRTIIHSAQSASSAAIRDDLECAERILGLLDAEQSFLLSHEQDLMLLYKKVDEQLGLMGSNDEVANLLNALSELKNKCDGADLLREMRLIYQGAIPLLASLAEEGEVHAGAALDQLVDLETSQLEAIHRRRIASDERTRSAQPARTGAASAAAQAAAMPGIHNINPATLRDYLRAVFPNEPQLEIVSVADVPGGRSKETTMVVLAGVRALPTRIVFRSDIPGGLVPSRTVDEYRILEIAHSHGIAVPTPLHSEANPNKLGLTFIIVSAVEGSTQGEYFPDLGGRVRDKVGVGRQLARILARIHAIPVAELAGTHIPTDVDLTEYVRQTVESTYAQAREQDFPTRTHIELAYRWLSRNMHLAQDQPCLIHCDVGLHNMLIDDDDRISAMLDWELATLASPAREISKIFHLIDYLMPREEFFAEYRAAGGPQSALDPDRLNFYAIMNYMVTHQRARYANRLFYSGQIDTIVMAHAGYDSFYRGSSLISNALKPVYAGAYGGLASKLLADDPN